MVLRLSELYASFQGEGPNAGRPTVFVRFAGCNLKCPGWPCDTPQAIDPKIFTKEQRLLTPEALGEEIVALGIPYICLTGGEVFLQPAQDLESLLQYLYKHHTSPVEIEVFTNGTLEIPPQIRKWLETIVLDWKLPGSGESSHVRNDAVLRNIRNFSKYDAIKFTIKDRIDFEVARQRFRDVLVPNKLGGVVVCGPVWGQIDSSELADWILQDRLPWFLNTQVHKYVWKPEARYT